MAKNQHQHQERINYYEDKKVKKHIYKVAGRNKISQWIREATQAKMDAELSTGK